MSNKLLAVLAALIINASGCAATQKFPPKIIKKDIVVSYEHETTLATYQDSIRAATYILYKWEQDHRISKAANISITQRLTLTYGQKTHVFTLFGEEFHITTGGKRARGVCSGSNIRVVAGRYSTLPSLSHELCHLNFAPKDVDHLHPSWDTWNERAWDINHELISLWFDSN